MYKYQCLGFPVLAGVEVSRVYIYIYGCDVAKVGLIPVGRVYSIQAIG